MELLHFTGQVWRPPYEANAQLLQVTAGCTHGRCRFCSLYAGTDFRLSPRAEIEADLEVIRQYQPRARRVFLTGANPFVLSYNRLLDLGLLIRKYLPCCESIGCFARVTDVGTKSVEELGNLRHVGFDGISIGTESGDDGVLARMDKGYTASDIVEQCRKLEEAGMRYNVVYLAGLAGKGGGVRNAVASAEVFNRLRPFIINVVSLTLFPDSVLYREMREGKFAEASELERLEEVRRLISELTVETTLLGNTVSNAVPLSGGLPRERARLLRELDEAMRQMDEEGLRRYRESIRSL